MSLILLIGAILCRKERTVAVILRVMGLGNDPHFTNYHQVLSKARWSGLQAAKILLGLLVALVPMNCPIIIGVDDTIERRSRNSKAVDRQSYCPKHTSIDGSVLYCVLDIPQIDLKGKETDTTRYPSTAWYQKPEVTFSDVLTFVRRHIWSSKYDFPMEFLTTSSTTSRLSGKTQLLSQPTAWRQKQCVTSPRGSTAIRRYSWDSKYVMSAHDTRYVLFPAQEWEAILDLLAAVA